MKPIDRKVQREFKRSLNEHHGGFVIGMLVLIGLALALVGHPELGISIYVATGFGVSIVFKRIYRRVGNAEKGG